MRPQPPFWSSPVWLARSDTPDGSWLGSSHGQKPAATTSWPCLRARGNICPHNWAMERSQQNAFSRCTPASLSWAIILFLSLVFISCPSSFQPDGKLLGKSYPVIYSPGTEWEPKGVLGKRINLTLVERNKFNPVLRRGRRAGVSLRS